MKLSSADNDWDFADEQWLELEFQEYDYKKLNKSSQIQIFNQRDKQRADWGWSSADSDCDFEQWWESLWRDCKQMQAILPIS